MEELKEFTIPFKGLKIGKHRFEFEITKSFFEHFDYDEFENPKIDLVVILDKKSTLLDMFIEFQGNVGVLCDITNEPYQQEIQGEYHFVVKFGESYNDENEDLLILPHGTHEVNIQQQVYESIVLAQPSRRIHPGIKDGTLKSEILEKLEELSPKDLDSNEAEETDPRWDDLKKLLTDK